MKEEKLNKPDLKTPEITTGKYQHYKGGEYEVIGVSLHSETLEPMVIYKPLYETNIQFWVRPFAMFNEELVIGGKKIPRFKKIK
jgi:hypothetical protein